MTQSMARAGFLSACVVAIVSSGVSYFSHAQSQTAHVAEAVSNADRERPKALQSYGQLPLSFEVNRGQAKREVKFMARGQGYGLFLTSGGATLRLARPNSNYTNSAAQLNGGSETLSTEETNATLTMRFAGSRSVSRPEGLNELPGKSNYFIGNRAKSWHTNVSTYSKILYRNIYPGIDLVYYGNQRQLEYDLVVAPGASPGRVRMAFAGTRKVSVDAGGNLVLSTAAGDISQHKPFAYQQINGTRHEVTAAYRIDRGAVCFELGNYDRNLPLIIDPVLVYSSFVGGTGGEEGLGIAVDSQGSAYLTGNTISSDFPVAAALQGTKNVLTDAFVVKLNPTGNAMVYSTYLGGNATDWARAIAVDSQGSAYVTGITGSGSFPVTPGAFQDMKDGTGDAFVTKLSPSGSALEYSTFIGGENSDTAFSIAIDNSNRAYVAGNTGSTRFRNIPFQTPRKGNPVYKSNDAGANWSASSSGLTANLVNSLTQDPTTPTTIYAGTNLGVFKTIDAGANWTLTGSGTLPIFTYAVVADPSNSSTVYAATTTGIYKSTDGGSSYTRKIGGTALDLAVDPHTPAILYTGIGSTVYKSTDGGDSWVAINNGATTFGINKVVIDGTQNPATTVYLGTSSRGVFKTTNGGGLWTQINNGISNSTPISVLAIDPTNPSTLYIAGSHFTVYKTTNGGASWSPSGNGITTPSINTIAVDPLNGATVYATSSVFGVYKTSDGGANWTESNSGLLNRVGTAVAVDRTNTANVYTGFSIGGDAFAMRLTSSGGLDYLVNFGGNESDEARGVTVDSAGNAYVTGTTFSNNLPVTNALQPVSGGSTDAFVAKLNSSGTAFNYLTYLGGTNSEEGRGIAVHGENAYVTGSTFSSDFPLANALNGTLGFQDAFVTKLSPAGNALEFSTFLGGQNLDQGFGIAVDALGSAYVTGVTSSSDFPVVSAPQAAYGAGSDAFVTKLNSSGNSIAYSTYLGGVETDQGNGIAVDTAGNAYIIGDTTSTDFPTVSPLQSYRGDQDAFVAKLSSDGPVGGYLRFSAATFNTTESSGSTTITVERVGDASQACNRELRYGGKRLRHSGLRDGEWLRVIAL